MRMTLTMLLGVAFLTGLAGCFGNQAPTPKSEQTDAPKMEQHEVDALCQGLLNPDVHVREDAARALGNLKPPSEVATPALMEATKDPNDGVRCLAVAALGKNGLRGEKVIPVLSVAMKDESWQVRVEAVKALYRFSQHHDQAIQELSN